jgi:hypothetical protein
VAFEHGTCAGAGVRNGVRATTWDTGEGRARKVLSSPQAAPHQGLCLPWFSVLRMLLDPLGWLRSREGVDSTVNCTLCTMFGRSPRRGPSEGDTMHRDSDIASEHVFPHTHFVPVRSEMGFERTARRHKGVSLVLVSEVLPRSQFASRENTYPSQYPSPRTSHPRKPRIRTERGVS